MNTDFSGYRGIRAPGETATAFRPIRIQEMNYLGMEE
jgi:hypothetical protein